MRPLMQVRRLNDGWTMRTSGKTDRPSVRSIAQQATVMIDASLLPLLRKAKSANSFRSSLVASPSPRRFTLGESRDRWGARLIFRTGGLRRVYFSPLTLDGDAQRLARRRAAYRDILSPTTEIDVFFQARNITRVRSKERWSLRINSCVSRIKHKKKKKKIAALNVAELWAKFKNINI